jgi:hypothetical protein
MGRVLVQQWVSVDGMVAGPDGETDVFDAVPDFSASDRHNTALLDSVDEVLLGRRTYEEFVQFWPTADGEALAPLINALPKTVASTTLGSAPWGEHPPARIVPDAVEHIRSGRGRARPGPRSCGAASPSCAHSCVPTWWTTSRCSWHRCCWARARRCWIPPTLPCG